MGAKVHGFALDPQPHERLYDSLRLSKQLASDTRSDIRNADSILRAIDEVRPEFVFHLAAQPLVRLSFEIPVETFQTNVMGTIHLLEAIRSLNHPCVCIAVTTDKCYENREWLHSYREEDAMGGYDPYSASKGCAELAIAAYRRSFFSSGSEQKIASARAGNVIGGGDWAIDRIVPDIFRAAWAGRPVPVRNKLATRPWQHVLEPLSGYLWLAACLDRPSRSGFSLEELTTGFNFGPALASNRTVADVVTAVLEQIDGSWEDHSDPQAPHEASKLNLAIDKAFHMLRWSPTWDFDETIRNTVQWYQNHESGGDTREITLQQIHAYGMAAARCGPAWASNSTTTVLESVALSE